MSLIVNGTEIENVIYNGTELTELVFNGVKVWEKILGDQLSRLIDGTITEVTAEDLQGLTTIGINAFAGCSLLKSVKMPNSITSIGMSAFAYCSALTEVMLSSELTAISGSAFGNCSSLEEITIPSKVTSIDSLSFSTATSLKTIKMLPKSPPTLAAGAFPTTITRIEVPSANLSIYQSATNWTSYASKMVGV